MAAVLVMALVLIGAVSHALYVKIVHPSKKWVVPVHPRLFSMALAAGLGAGVAEAFFSYAGTRAVS